MRKERSFDVNKLYIKQNLKNIGHIFLNCGLAAACVELTHDPNFRNPNGISPLVIMSYGFLFLAAYNINKIASTNERKILENHIMDLALNAADEFAVPLMNDEEIINFSMNYAAKICNDITDIQ